MKKSNLQIAIKNAMKPFYKAGLTNTAKVVQSEILKAVDKAYKQK